MSFVGRFVLFWSVLRQGFHCISVESLALLKGVSLQILSSPQDIEGAMSPSEISNALGLANLKNRTWAIFKTSAIKGEGLEEAMEW